MAARRFIQLQGQKTTNIQRGSTPMIEKMNRARFERVRRERERRDRAIRIQERYLDRKDYSGSEWVSNIPAASGRMGSTDGRSKP